MQLQILGQKKYLLAVSGGIDSMVMAELFLKDRITFSVAHCNFQLRDIESEQDETMVKSWCHENEIPFFVQHFDTRHYADENKLSIQEAARILRYQFFYDLLDKEKFDFIATAHHRDDNIETVLFHFFRGTGIQGLTGIPFQNNKIIRPVLHVTKTEILAFAAKNNIPYRNDSSNSKSDYTRNKLRNEIIPQLELMFPSFKNNIADNTERFKEVNEVYLQQLATLNKKLIEQRGSDFYIPLLKLKKIQPQKTILFELLKPFNFSFQQCLQILDLNQRQTGSLVENEFYQVIKNRNFLIVTQKNTTLSEMILIERDEDAVATNDFTLHFKKATHFEEGKDHRCCQIDADRLEYPLLLRKWRQGDYLYPFGMKKKKKVSRVLIDLKIPLHEKEKVWVLESAKKIIWIVGLKTDERYKIGAKTRQMLQINLQYK